MRTERLRTLADGVVAIALTLLALELPLKVLIWQDVEGRAWVSYNATAYLADRFGIPRDLLTNIAGIDALVDAALQP